MLSILLRVCGGNSPDDIQGLVAPGRATEALEIARDAARKVIEAQAQHAGSINLAAIADSFGYPL